MNISCAPREMISLTRTSIFTGHSFINGEIVLDDSSIVNEQTLNLSVSRPEWMPHRSTCFSIKLVGILTTKSPVSLIKRWEYLEGLTDMLNKAGSEQTTPHQAIVIIFGL